MTHDQWLNDMPEDEEEIPEHYLMEAEEILLADRAEVQSWADENELVFASDTSLNEAYIADHQDYLREKAENLQKEDY